MEYYSSTKRTEAVIPATVQMSLRSVILSESSQAQKTT